MLSGIQYRVNRGFTLVEVMITMVIVAIGVALAMPTWENAVQKRMTTSAAEELAAFFTHAQSEAVRGGELVTVTIQRNVGGTNWCAGSINQTQMDAVTETHCHCWDNDPTVDKFCEFDDETPRRITASSYEGFLMDRSAEDVGRTGDNHLFFSFDPIRGIKLDELGNVVSDSPEVTLISDNGKHKLKVEVAVTGRVRICSPIAAKAVPGYKACTAGPILLP